MRKQKNLNILTFEGMEASKAYFSKQKLAILENSWAGTFRAYILPNLPFGKLAQHYSQDIGRSTKDMVTSMGAMVLQQIFDLTDSETREHLAFNQQWHYALETYDQTDQLFCEKTIWTVRYHLTKDGSGQDIFNNVTDELIKIFKVDTRKQRIDSVHIYSNMAKLGRVRVMSHTITKFLRNLKRHFPELYKSEISEELRDHYTKEESGGYFGNSKPSESQKRLSEIGADLYWLIEKYSVNKLVNKMDSYRLMERVLSEQCKVSDGKVEIIPNKEVPSDSLQNPSDIDAGYDGHKGQGYQVQFSETYNREDSSDKSSDPAEVLDLITYTKTESASKHDSKALSPALEQMDEREIKPDEMLADGLYGSDSNISESEEKGVAIISPVIGKKSERDFSSFTFNSKTKEVIACSNGKQPLTIQHKKSTITAGWTKEECMGCPLKDMCQTNEGKKMRRLRYTEKELRLWQRRQKEKSPEFKDKYRYRAGIEGTNSRFIHMMGARRVRYRGLKRVGFAETMKAVGINMFRVARYLRKTGKIVDPNHFSNLFYRILVILIKIYIIISKKKNLLSKETTIYSYCLNF